MDMINEYAKKLIVGSDDEILRNVLIADSFFLFIKGMTHRFYESHPNDQ